MSFHAGLVTTDLHVAGYITNSDPGAVGANLLWFDTSTTPATLKIRNSGNSGWNAVQVGAGAAPADAHYVTTQAESGLSNESSLGALTTGLLKISVSASIATPSTAVEGTDYWKPGGTDVAVADGGTGASTAAGARANLVVAGYNDAGNSGSSLTIDWAVAHTQLVTLTAAPCTFTFSNPVAGDVYVLYLKQDGGGSKTASWPGNVIWPGGTTPTLTTTAAKVDIITFTYDGTSFRGVTSGQNYA